LSKLSLPNTADYSKLEWKQASKSELQTRYSKEEICLISRGATDSDAINSSLTTDQIDRYGSFADNKCSGLDSFATVFKETSKPRGCSITGNYFCTIRHLPILTNKKGICGASFPDRLPYYTSHWDGLPAPASGNTYYSSLMNTLQRLKFKKVSVLGDSIADAFQNTIHLEHLRKYNRIKQLNITLVKSIYARYIPCGLGIVGLKALDPKISFEHFVKHNGSKCTDDNQAGFLYNHSLHYGGRNNSLVITSPLGAHLGIHVSVYCILYSVYTMCSLIVRCC